jgi:hypothetical protein
MVSGASVAPWPFQSGASCSSLLQAVCEDRVFQGKLTRARVVPPLPPSSFLPRTVLPPNIIVDKLSRLFFLCQDRKRHISQKARVDHYLYLVPPAFIPPALLFRSLHHHDASSSFSSSVYNKTFLISRLSLPTLRDFICSIKMTL